MPCIKVKNSAGKVERNKREYALLQQLGNGTGEFDSEELAAFERYGDKGKLAALQGDVDFGMFAEAFKMTPTAPEIEGTGNCIGWAVTDAKAKLKAWRFPRREPRPNDVVIQITYSGLCHSDIHQCRNEWGGSMYPMVPGHEIVGVVTETGADVKKFKVGQYAAVGCMVDACLSCTSCKRGDEQYCLGPSGPIMTYNAKDTEGVMTQGGYSSHIVVREEFCLRIDREMHEAGTAPLLCAGITTYEPMKAFGVDKPDQKVGVVGLGGLGHMVVKFSKAFGQECTVISRSYKKQELAKGLGADNYVATSDTDAVSGMSEKLDAIIDTVSSDHNIDELLGMLKVDGQLIFVGLPPNPQKFSMFSLVPRRRALRASFIGGIPMTQQMLDFCKEKNIRSDVEVIGISEVNEAYDRMEAGDVKFRFVLDILKGMAEE